MTPDDGFVTRVPITSATDLVNARQRGRALANELGFSPGQAALIASAISELARNIVTYAGRGEIVLWRDGDSGLGISARDNGPGILDIAAAMRAGYSTSSGLGLGLPGVRRIADTFDIASGPQGTTVSLTMRKR